MPVLATKLYIPQPRPEMVHRPRLIDRLDAGLHRKLTLVSAPAGFGKTTLVSEWVAGSERPTAWLSLDEGDNDPARFLTYLVAALQTVAADVGQDVLDALQSPQPPPPESILTALLNEIATIPNDFALVLDDYHVIDAAPVDQALAFLIEHLPPRVHMVVATREDPHVPLPRLRGRGQLAEVRVADLRFTPHEATGFLNQVMGLDLSPSDVAALETRTEGWIAGLQLAALSMQNHDDAAGFIESFTGSHRYVMDYLVEEVLHRQPEQVQTFLLYTSILDRLCGPLCDAVLGAAAYVGSGTNGQKTLEHIDHANLFVVPLDDERRWYRYHHLFADLLRQRLRHRTRPAADKNGPSVDELHVRASAWYEAEGLGVEAFRHAAAANDVERAIRLIRGDGMPLQFRGGAAPILKWLASLPTAVLDAHPSLWVTYASALLVTGQVAGVAEKAAAAEAALQESEPGEETRDLIGRVASIRATLAVTRHEADAIIEQAHRALEYLHPDNLPVRASITWTLGYAYELQGDRAAARQAYTEAVSKTEAIGHTTILMMANMGLATLQKQDNQLDLAERNYERILEMVGDPPPPPVCDVHLGLAHIFYERDDLDAAEQHGQQSVRLARQIDTTDRFVSSEVLLARVKLARGDVAGAAAMLTEARRAVDHHHFRRAIPEVVDASVRTLLHQGDQAAAADLARTHDHALSRARVHLAQDDPTAALALLEPWRREVENRGWADERLRAMALQAVAHHALGEPDQAVDLLEDVLALAEPEGFVRTFVDEGQRMGDLLSEAAARNVRPVYVGKLLAAIEEGLAPSDGAADRSPALPLDDPLSERELEVLRLVAAGLSNRQISERLYLAVSTVKGHNSQIFDKLQVRRRTQAVARAREIGLL